METVVLTWSDSHTHSVTPMNTEGHASGAAVGAALQLGIFVQRVGPAKQHACGCGCLGLRERIGRWRCTQERVATGLHTKIFFQTKD